MVVIEVDEDDEEAIGWLVSGGFLFEFLATLLCAEYTWFSNCLYMPNVAVHTVHL